VAKVGQMGMAITPEWYQVKMLHNSHRGHYQHYQMLKDAVYENPGWQLRPPFSEKKDKPMFV